MKYKIVLKILFYLSKGFLKSGFFPTAPEALKSAAKICIYKNGFAFFLLLCPTRHRWGSVLTGPFFPGRQEKNPKFAHPNICSARRGPGARSGAGLGGFHAGGARRAERRGAHRTRLAGLGAGSGCRSPPSTLPRGRLVPGLDQMVLLPHKRGIERSGELRVLDSAGFKTVLPCPK